jgi:hypothetical protein
MKWQKVKRPARGQLAKDVRSPSAAHYVARLEKEWSHWEGVKESAADLADTAVKSLANEFTFNLGNLKEIGKAIPEDRQAGERWLRYHYNALGVLTMSLFCKDIFTFDKGYLIDGCALPDGRRGTILPELPFQKDGRILDPALHLHPEVADWLIGPARGDAAATWYARSDRQLYVRRLSEARPSEPFMHQLMEENVRVDFTPLQTLVPYLRASQ